MQDNLVFKASLVKRTLGWSVCLGAAGGLVAMIYGIFTHPEAQVPSELLSGAVIGAFLIGLMWAGIAGQHIRWSIDSENVIYKGLFKNKTIPISDLAGFGQITVIVTAVPFLYVDLYGHKLNHIARFPINYQDWPKAEAWLAARLRHVVNDGSHIFPKFRFTDTPKV